MSPTRFASEHRWIYVGAIVLLVALAVVGVIQYDSVKTTNKATDKANQLADAAVAAGYPRPETKKIARALGTDGGIVCKDPGSARSSATRPRCGPRPRSWRSTARTSCTRSRTRSTTSRPTTR
ncbi:hypothetical protein OG407_25630 [Streptomyces sp. NBC_01515]|uniref:hypothetical protein n=1 Tax=Streptomyces sp. NBC_01515 TaxID=2903890 RepID=UPI003865A1E8